MASRSGLQAQPARNCPFVPGPWPWLARSERSRDGAYDLGANRPWRVTARLTEGMTAAVAAGNLASSPRATGPEATKWSMV
jgi:hypothetical protein